MFVKNMSKCKPFVISVLTQLHRRIHHHVLSCVRRLEKNHKAAEE